MKLFNSAFCAMPSALGSLKRLDSAFCILPSALGSWLPDMDLNHDKQIQSLLCYRYTIGQSVAGTKLVEPLAESSR